VVYGGIIFVILHVHYSLAALRWLNVIGPTLGQFSYAVLERV